MPSHGAHRRTAANLPAARTDSGLASTTGGRVVLAAMALLTVAVVVTLGVVGYALVRDDVAGDRPGAGVSPTATGDPTASADPVRSVPADAKVLFLGDDWTAGAGAVRPRGGFAPRAAALLGWDYRVDAVPGSGWAHPAPDVPGSLFLDRVIRMPSGATDPPDLVVVSAQMPSPARPSEVRLLMRQTVSVLLDRTPDSLVAVVLPYDDPQALGWCEPLESDRVLCLDPYRERWLPAADRAAYLTAEGVPTVAGHTRFADRLVADLRRELTIR